MNTTKEMNMKSVYARITKQDDEGCFFTWVEMFECRNLFLNEIYRLEQHHGRDNIGFNEISMGDFLIANRRTA